MTVSRLSFLLGVLACLLAAASCSKPSADSHVARGDEFMKQGMRQEAVIEYRNAMQIDPQRGDVRLKLAEIYFGNRDFGPALREYVRAADLLPQDASAQVKAGGLLLLAGAFEDAQSRARKALELEPSNGDALILLANSKAGLKDLDGALAQYQEALSLNPTDRTYYGMGTLQMARGETAEAEESFRKAVDVAPKSLVARLALANFLWSTRRLEDAEREFKHALEIEGGNVLAHRALGTFYMLSDRAPEAEPHFKAIAESAKSTEAAISLADYYLLTKRVPEARKVLDELAKDTNAWAQASTKLAAIDALEGYRAQGTDRLRAVLAKHPEERAAQLLLARLLLSDGKREEAMNEATALVRADPNGRLAAEAHMLIGNIHAALDRRNEAIKSFNEVLAKHPQPFGAQLALASLHLSQRETDKASTFIQQALTLQPKNPYARALKVRILLAERKSSQARAELAELQKEYPNAVPVLNLLAAEQLATGQAAAARAHYARAAAINPGDIEALTGLVQIDLATGKTAEARARVDQALKLGDKTGSLLILSALVHEALNELDQMEELLQKAVELDPARLRGYGLLARLYVRQNRLAEAEKQFQEMIARNPTAVGTNTMLGMLLEMRGKTAEAEKQYEKVLAIDGNAAVAANNLAYMYADQGRNLDQALQLAQTAQRGLPNEANAIDTLGWVYYRKGMASAAVRELETAVKLNPKDPTLRFHLGMAYNQMGEVGKARTTLKEALALGQFPGADEARKTLAGLGG
jgi:tetratricopeptide (TPR) repeat protein